MSHISLDTIHFFFGDVDLDEGPEEGGCSVISVSSSCDTENLFVVEGFVCPGLSCLDGLGAVGGFELLWDFEILIGGEVFSVVLCPPVEVELCEIPRPLEGVAFCASLTASGGVELCATAGALVCKPTFSAFIIVFRF